jgi:hypothetical protein
MDIELVEFHDARLRELVLLEAGSLFLRFAHLVVYERRVTDLYDVVSYRAELIVRGVSELRCLGAINEKDRLSIARVDDEEVLSATDAALSGDGRSARSVELIFAAGTSLHAKCTHIILELQERGRILETWEGPLDPESGRRRTE